MEKLEKIVNVIGGISLTGIAAVIGDALGAYDLPATGFIGLTSFAGVSFYLYHRAFKYVEKNEHVFTGLNPDGTPYLPKSSKQK